MDRGVWRGGRPDGRDLPMMSWWMDSGGIGGSVECRMADGGWRMVDGSQAWWAGVEERREVRQCRPPPLHPHSSYTLPFTFTLILPSSSSVRDWVLTSPLLPLTFAHSHLFSPSQQLFSLFSHLPHLTFPTSLPHLPACPHPCLPPYHPFHTTILHQ